MEKEKILIEVAKKHNINPDYLLIDNDEVIWDIWNYSIEEYIFIPKERFIISKKEFVKFKEEIERRIKEIKEGEKR